VRQIVNWAAPEAVYTSYFDAAGRRTYIHQGG
jgi:hypothetical protein